VRLTKEFARLNRREARIVKELRSSPNKMGRIIVWNCAVELRGFKTMRDPFTAGILSFFIPGVGQLYNGRILAGILWLIITPGFWIGSGGTLGWICHIIAAYTAYSYAKDHPVRT
jgi:TM2 domain-containing membrane protein YozV